MVKPSLLELAKQGDDQAIMSVLNYFLQEKNITAKVARKDDCLLVLLKSAQVPDKKSSVTFIYKLLIQLGVESIKSVQIYGKQNEQKSPAWMESIDLQKTVAESPKQSPNLASLFSVNLKASAELWPLWLPYPSSWLRAFIFLPLLAIIFVIIFRVASFWGLLLSSITNRIELLLLTVGLGVLIPILLIAYVHYCFYLLWNKHHHSTNWCNWFPPPASLWEGFYGTVVLLLSVLTTLIIILPFIPNIPCKFEAIPELERYCHGLSQIALYEYRKDYNLDEIGAIIWLISASYLYQAEYIIKQRVVPKINLAIQNYPRQKAQKLAKKLIIILLIPLVAVGIYLFSQFPNFEQIQSLPVASPSPKLTPSSVSSDSPTASYQSDHFREAVNKAMSAAQLTQSAKSQQDWNLVASEWQDAIALMKSVPSSSPNYGVAQQKIVEYQKNIEYAESATNQAK